MSQGPEEQFALVEHNVISEVVAARNASLAKMDQAIGLIRQGHADATEAEDLAAAHNMDPEGVPPDLLPGPLGIVAVVKVVGYVSELDGKRTRYGIDTARALEIVVSAWFCGPVGWVLDDVRQLATPIPCKGAQGLWNVPPDVESLVVSQLRSHA